MRSTFARARILAVAAVASLAIAGCGGDDDTIDSTGASGATGVTGAPLTEEEFVSQGNAICDDVNSQLRALEAPTNDLPSVATFTEQALAIIEPALAQFQAITPPADLQSQWDDYLSQAEEQLANTKELQAAAEAGDAQQVKSLLAEVQAVDNDQNARELGLDVCAEDTTPEG